MSDTSCKVLLFHPRFPQDSYWNHRTVSRMIGAKWMAPPLNLLTIAAMLPADWEVRLVDENIEALTDEELAWADLVMLGAMVTQRPAALEVIDRAQAAGKRVMIGGPDTTLSPQIYARADYQFLGEAEGVIEQFFEDWQNGVRKRVYEAPKFTADVTTTPVPRYDLLNHRDYATLSLQFSRGCPFLCEFCDIIEIFGRNPRTKTRGQVLAELDALYATGHRGFVDFVDDNLIGNKAAVRAIMPEIIAWQKAHGYPFYFSTEASLNLADDPDFLELMREAAFNVIFVGIESPDPGVLVKMRKKQNTKRDIAESIRTIYGAGIAVIAGLILGCDEEPENAAEGIVEVIEESAIGVATALFLWACPGTQLERRLAAEGRLHDPGPMVDLRPEDCSQSQLGLNFDTLRPREDVLNDMRRVVSRLYTPEAFFGRIRRMATMLDMSGANGRITRGNALSSLRKALAILWSVTRHHPEMRRPFWRLVVHTARRNRRALRPVITLAAFYAHLGPFAGRVEEIIETRIAEEIESGIDMKARATPRPLAAAVAGE